MRLRSEFTVRGVQRIARRLRASKYRWGTVAPVRRACPCVIAQASRVRACIRTYCTSSNSLPFLVSYEELCLTCERPRVLRERE
jgi:hypothetical protein